MNPTPITDRFENNTDPSKSWPEFARRLEVIVHELAAELRAKRVFGWHQPDSPGLAAINQLEDE